MNWNMEQAGSNTYGFTNDDEGNARRDFIKDLLLDMLKGK